MGRIQRILEVGSAFHGRNRTVEATASTPGGGPPLSAEAEEEQRMDVFRKASAWMAVRVPMHEMTPELEAMADSYSDALADRLRVPRQLVHTRGTDWEEEGTTPRSIELQMAIGTSWDDAVKVRGEVDATLEVRLRPDGSVLVSKGESYRMLKLMLHLATELSRLRVGDPHEGSMIRHIQSSIAWIEAYYAQLQTERGIDVDDLCGDFS